MQCNKNHKYWNWNWNFVKNHIKEQPIVGFSTPVYFK